MAQTAHNGRIRFHPSGAVEAEGVTENGRVLSVYLKSADVEILYKTVMFAEAHGLEGHLGHANWHVVNPDKDTENCSLCNQIKAR